MPLFKRSLCLWLLFAIAIQANATNYYFSSTEGDDSRSSQQAQSPSSPWKTLARLNAIFNTLQPGDSVLFRRGDVFYGSINPSASGSSGSPIVLGAYGAGEKPVITGFTSFTGWYSKGGNTWEIDAA